MAFLRYYHFTQFQLFKVIFVNRFVRSSELWDFSLLFLKEFLKKITVFLLDRKSVRKKKKTKCDNLDKIKHFWFHSSLPFSSYIFVFHVQRSMGIGWCVGDASVTWLERRLLAYCSLLKGRHVIHVTCYMFVTCYMCV